MWAMMPMLRTLVRSVRTSSATVLCLVSCRRMYRSARGRVRTSDHQVSAPGCSGGAARDGSGLPAVVREGLVGLGHLVRVLATLHRGAETVAGVEDLVHEALGHGLLTALPRVADEPAQGESRGPVRLDLDRHLVGRTADATGLDLDGGLDVVQSALQGGDRVGAGLLAGTLEGAVDDGLRDRLLAVEEDLVDQLGDQGAVVHRVDDQRALRSGSLARHQLFSFFAP